jgi:NAD-dependent DNA ligase
MIRNLETMDELKLKVENQNVVLTGIGPAPRKTLVSMLEQYGAVVQSTITTDTTLLICENPSRNTVKLKKAKDNGITIKNYGEVFIHRESEMMDGTV